MNKRPNFDFGVHNEKVCNYLGKKPSYSDWVITTAFYSAYQFVLYKLFPLIDEKGQPYINFEQYCFIKGITTEKHKAITNLVEHYIPKIGPQYNQLKDQSWNARYQNYQLGRELANHAKKLLQQIKVHCAK